MSDSEAVHNRRATSKLPTISAGALAPASAPVHKQPNYAGVFWSLFVLTILEITAANAPFAKTLVVVTLVTLALVKASLVALYYMHLKFEKYVFYIIVFFPLLLAVILTVLVLADKAIV